MKISMIMLPLLEKKPLPDLPTSKFLEYMSGRVSPCKIIYLLKGVRSKFHLTNMDVPQKQSREHHTVFHFTYIINNNNNNNNKQQTTNNKQQPTTNNQQPTSTSHTSTTTTTTTTSTSTSTSNNDNLLHISRTLSPGLFMTWSLTAAAIIRSLTCKLQGATIELESCTVLTSPKSASAKFRCISTYSTDKPACIHAKRHAWVRLNIHLCRNIFKIAMHTGGKQTKHH